MQSLRFLKNESPTYITLPLYLLFFPFPTSNQAGTEQVKYCVEKQTKERQDFNLEKEENKNLRRTTVSNNKTLTFCEL